MDSGRSVIDSRISGTLEMGSTQTLEMGSRRSEMDSRRSEIDYRRSGIDYRHSEIHSRHLEMDSRRSEIDSRRSGMIIYVQKFFLDIWELVLGGCHLILYILN